MGLIFVSRPFSIASKREAIRELLENTVPDRDFYILVLGAIILAACGILTDSIPVLVASMIVAPLAYPILSMALAILARDGKLLTQDMIRIVMAIIFVALLAPLFILQTAAQSLDAQKKADTHPTSTTATTTSMGTSTPLFERASEAFLQQEDVTKPEAEERRGEILSFFEKREARNLGVTNFLAYAVQKSVHHGMPANTVILVLLLPLLATVIAIVRLIVGLPSLEMLVPIALAVTLIASGISAGFIILVTILIASFLSRILLKRLRIMQLPKMVLSLLIVSFCVFGVLGVSAAGDVLNIQQLSIFPVLILILLSDKIVAIHLQRSIKETVFITLITIGLGIGGYLILTWGWLRTAILLYPEILLLLIPINIAIGRYLGLRITERFRFASLKTYDSQ